MFKKVLFFCLFLLFAQLVNCQTYTNNWINYTQKYYKIKVVNNGIYRIDSASLANAISSSVLSTIDPRKFQVFNKGNEQNIYVKGESDGAFNSSDFIEFYAEKNDGKLDSAIYFNAPYLPNPYYSLFNDTATYYLTWNNSISNNRMQSLISDSTLFPSLNPANYFFKEELKSFNHIYYTGETYFYQNTDSRYIASEGWFGDVFGVGGNDPDHIDYNGILYTDNIYSSGPSSKISIGMIGQSQNSQVFGNDHHIQVSINNHIFKDTLFRGYPSIRFVDANFATTSLGSPYTNFNFTSVFDPGFISNRTAVSFINIKYPHTFNLNGSSHYTMYLPDDASQSQSYITINNLVSSGLVHFYDLSNGKRIDVVSNGALHKVIIPNSGNEKKCFVTSDGFIAAISNLIPVTLTGQFTDYSSYNGDSSFVIVTNKVLRTEADNYANYRRSIAGGMHHVVVADIDDLYDQFAYGIAKNPLAIRNFANYLIHAYTSPPQNLFIIGKAINSSLSRSGSPNYEDNLVPSIGYPASDNLFTAGLNNTLYECAIPTGRLAAKTGAEVQIYHDKIADYESTPPDEWKKQILHFGGGNDVGQQTAFKNYLNQCKTIIEVTDYGGNVTSFFKTSSAPISIVPSSQISGLINNGVSLMTFFGHSGPTVGFDQGIDDVNTYNPIQGHYPFILANGCYSGDIHSPYVSYSENFILAQNKGAIGYLASVSEGIPQSLFIYSKEFYENLSFKNYNKSIGSCIQKAIKNLEAINSNATNISIYETFFDMTLHGDPSLKINTYNKPDFKITDSDVSFKLDSIVDTIVVSIVRTNLGMATDSLQTTELTRTFPDGTTSVFLKRNLSPYYKDIIYFKIPYESNRGAGLNNFKIKLDARSPFIDELNENNNTTGNIPLLINGNNIEPVYPYRFAIIPTDTITLKASTINAFAPPRNYIFQLDTNDTFLNPLRSIIINASGGVVKWKPTDAAFSFTDKTVYYWRVSPDSTSATNGYDWRESSFQYVNNKKGWEQAHFFQFKKDNFQYVNFNRPQRRFDFVNDLKAIECWNGISGPPPAIYEYDRVYKINGQDEYISSWVYGCQDGITFAYFNPTSGDPYLNYPQTTDSIIALSPCGLGHGLYGSYTGAGTTSHPFPFSENAFDFYNNTSTQLDTVAQFINQIPNGSYVLAYTTAYNHFQQYQAQANIKNAMFSIGAQKFDTISSSNKAYILFGKKGSPPGTATELVGDSLNAILHLNSNIITNWKNGFIASPVIGPAFSWDSLSWKQHTIDGAITHDSIIVSLIGVRADGTESIITNFNSNNLDISNLSSLVNVVQYPYIRLIAYMEDTTLNTPPQLERWQVFYSPVPEAAISPNLGYTISNSDVQEGDAITVRLPYQNVGAVSFTDSMLVNYWIEDANRNIHHLPNKLKKKPFTPNEVIMDTIQVSTLGNPGNDALWVELNPINQTRSQFEQYHFNNIVRIPFKVNNDKINPLLDVTFDGVHIINNDIVSAKPNILVKLKDENKFLALNDTSNFKLFLLYPNTQNEKQLFFLNTMTFTPAALPNNSCTINYTPILSQDGIYQLRVQAKDKSNNQSGVIDYRIRFEIINKPTITEVMNYPNPFTTATHFVFTLTGAQIPSNFKIQIMTITGKVVKEIFEEELGAIHVGRNITEYAWDGRDEFGDRLANGVYLYRVITKLNGDDIEKRETAADQYFKKGWGKMYLMR